jgi:hypothetical protein
VSLHASSPFTGSKICKSHAREHTYNGGYDAGPCSPEEGERKLGAPCGRKALLDPWGELQNSSMSSVQYMDTVWQNIQEMNVNTILGSVTWEDIEPQENQFDFNNLDGVLSAARLHGFRIILLWFGSFKNGTCL